MPRPICQHKDCEKEAISFSDFCGDHTEWEKIATAIQQLEAAEYENIFLKDVELENLKIIGKTFEFGTFSEVEFVNCIFTECTFNCSSFSNVVFDSCLFGNCLFEEAVELVGTTFVNSHLIDTVFKEVNFNQSSFQENTTVEDCTFEVIGFLGMQFWQMEMKGSKLQHCEFNQASVQECKWEAVEITEGSISKTVFMDSFFSNCHFINFEDDFEQMEDAFELCVFQLCKFEGVKIATEYAIRWNAFNEPLADFYLRIIQHVNDKVHLENLRVINTALQHLKELDVHNFELKAQVTDIFTKYINFAKKNKDLKGFGQIVEQLSNVPPEYLTEVNQFLPSPKTIEQNTSLLRITIHRSAIDLESLAQLFHQLRHIEKLTETKEGKLQVIDVRFGSIIIELTSRVEVIVFLVFLLYKGANLIMDFRKKALDIQKVELEKQKLALDIAKAQKELAAPEETELDKLQKEKLRLEIQQLKDQQLETLKAATNTEPESFLLPEAQEEAIDWGQKIIDGAETMDLYVQILEAK